MVLSAALQEAYAAVDVEGDLWETIELDHVALTAPERFVRGIFRQDVFESMDFPVEPGGDPQTFKVVDFSCELPSQEEDGPGKAKIRIDNVSLVLRQALRDAKNSDQPIRVTYRCYSSKDLDNPEVYSGLKLRSVSVTALSATGEISYDEIAMTAFPRATYDLGTYPALYGQS